MSAKTSGRQIACIPDLMPTIKPMKSSYCHQLTTNAIFCFAGNLYLLWLWEVGPKEEGGIHVRVQISWGPGPQLKKKSYQTLWLVIESPLCEWESVENLTHRQKKMFPFKKLIRRDGWMIVFFCHRFQSTLLHLSILASSQFHMLVAMKYQYCGDSTTASSTKWYNQ